MNTPLHMPDLVESLNKMKREKLTDILRRVAANPDKINEVARVLANDWMPRWKVDPKGKWTPELTDYK